MVVITDDPDPTFAAPFEPDALLRERCGVCAVAMAVLKCSACALQFCVTCEHAAHDAKHHQPQPPDAVKRELEETKSAVDATLIHQEHVVAVNLCQVCAQKPVEFLCIDCRSYQCEQCCAGHHLHVEDFRAHFFFCVEGSSPGLLRYAQWSPEFMEMAKMSHRVMLQRREDERAAAAQVKQEAAEIAAAAAANPPTISPQPPTPDSTPVQQPNSAEEIANVKMEQAHAALVEAQSEAPPAEPIHDMEALSIAEPPTAVKPEPQIVQQLQQQQQQPPPLPPAAEPPIQQQQSPPPPPAGEPITSTSTSQPSVKPEPTPELAPPAESSATQTPQPAEPTPPELLGEPASSSVKPEVQTSAPAPAPAVPTTTISSSDAIVDLTEDDDEIEGVKPERTVSSSFGRLGVAEQAMKRENSAWLQAAASSLTVPSGGNIAGDSVMLEDDDMGDTFEDPIKRTMVSEYNRLSEVIFNHEQEMASIQKQIKDLLANRSANMNEVVKFSNAAAKVKNSIVAETQNRNAAVARLVVYLKQDRAELNALLDESSVDIPHIQAASHRRCAQLEAIIRDKRFEIRQLKRSMEEAISIKTNTPFEEVSRLGAMVVAAEQAVRESEDARLVELIRLVQFSNEIRVAARAMSTS